MYKTRAWRVVKSSENPLYSFERVSLDSILKVAFFFSPSLDPLARP